MTAKRKPTARVRVTFTTTRETRDRIVALAARDRMEQSGIILEALFIHLHKLEAQMDLALRKRSVCVACGGLNDEARGRK